MNKGPLDIIINYYNSCEKLNQNILNSVGGGGGDFNSHNSLWGSNSTAENGVIVEEFLDNHGLVRINTGEGTRYNSLKKHRDAIKSTFLNRIIAGVSTWKVLKHSTVGSDHYPVMTTVGIKVCGKREKKFLDGNWEMLTGFLSKESVQIVLKNFKHKTRWT